RQQQAALYRGEGAQAAQIVHANADREVTVILADAQRDAQKLRGEGDAAATAIYAKAYGQDPGFYAFYRSLEAYRRALAGSNTTFVLSPHSDFFRYFSGWKGAAAEGPAAPAAAAIPPGRQPIGSPATVPAPSGR
ncbi:MAG: protease modulator HflC, partial [Stellaceae bacterium]